MTLNYPGPHEVRIYYTTNAVTHVQKLNCNLTVDPSPGDLFTAVSVWQRDGTSIALDVAVDQWVALMKPIFSSAASTIDYAELWDYPPASWSANFISSYDIAEAGTSGSSNVTASEVIQTFRTQEGGLMRIHFMETIYAFATTDTPPYGDAPLEAIRQYLIADDNWIMARDTSYPFASKACFKGQNEKLFKLRYRP